MQQRKHRISTAAQEIFIFYILAAAAAAGAFRYPEFWNFAGFHGENKTKLSIQMSSILLQAISSLMLAFRIYRGPEVERKIQEHDEITKELSEKFKNNLKLKSKQAYQEILDHAEIKNELNKHYSTAFSFGETERQVAIAGLLLFFAGTLLQLCSAG